MDSGSCWLVECVGSRTWRTYKSQYFNSFQLSFKPNDECALGCWGAVKATQIIAVLSLWTPRRKIYLTWTLRRNLSSEMDFRRSTESRKFLIGIQWPFAERGSSHTPYTRKNLRLNSQLPALCPTCATNQLRPALSHQNRTIYIPHFYKKDLIGKLGGNFHYTRWPPLCLGGTHFTLLPESVSPRL